MTHGNPDSRHHRGVDQRERDDVRRQGLSGRPRQRAYAIQTTPLPAEAVTPAEGVNQAHAKIHAHGERAIATLKTWKVLAKLRCCPRLATAIVQAILVLHRVEANRYAG